MRENGPATIYFLTGPLKADIEKKAMAEHKLSLSKLLRILALKYYLGEIILTENDFV